MEKTKTQKQNGFKAFFSKIGGFFKKVGSKIATYFKYLRPMVMMQLKDKLDFGDFKNKKKAMFKIVYAILKFAIVTALIYLIFYLIVYFGIFSFIRILNFRAFAVIMTIVLILSFFACLIKTTNTLYFAKDNPVLITMPVKNSMIFTSKLVVSFIYELVKNINYIMPFFIAYGIIMGLGIEFYLWSLVATFIFTLLSVSLSGLLSIPTMFVFIAFKKHRFLEFIVVGAIMAAVTYGVVYVIGLIPEDIDIIRDWGKIYWSLQDFLSAFVSTFSIFTLLIQMMTGMIYNSFEFNLSTSSNGIVIGAIFGIVIVCLALIYLLSKPLFLKMVSTPFEYKKNENIKKKKNRKKHAFVSSAVQQTKQIFRSANLIYSIVAVAIITPIAVYLQNKIIAAMDTKILGNYMGITFNILIILLMTLSSNSTIASIYSREGNSAYLNKVNPVAYAIPLSGKLVLNGLVNIVSIVVSTIIISVFSNIDWFGTFLLALALIFVYVAHLLWSAELDVMNPQNHQYQTTGDSQKNPNENLSTTYAFLISAVFAFICFFLLSEDIRVVFVKVLFIALAFCAIRAWLYFTRVKLYYKEK